MHTISNCGHDENGRYTGGKAGDQTGTEWQLRSWYNRPWDCVLRHPSGKVRAKIAELAEKAARNDRIGYDQGERSTFWDALKANNYNPAAIKKPCETDCSAGVMSIIRAVGYLLDMPALKTVPITSTHYMRGVLKGAGFTVLTGSKFLISPDYLLPGDILLNEQSHTATNISRGALAGSGDDTPEPAPSNYAGRCSVKLAEMVTGNYGPEVRTVQILLNAKGYKGADGKALTVDGEYGSNTAYAVEQMQRKAGMEGINFGTVSNKTWKLLIG